MFFTPYKTSLLLLLPTQKAKFDRHKTPQYEWHFTRGCACLHCFMQQQKIHALCPGACSMHGHPFQCTISHHASYSTPLCVQEASTWMENQYRNLQEGPASWLPSATVRGLVYCVNGGLTMSVVVDHTSTSLTHTADASVKLTRSMCDLTERQLATVLPVLEPYIANELLVARCVCVCLACMWLSMICCCNNTVCKNVHVGVVISVVLGTYVTYMPSCMSPM